MSIRIQLRRDTEEAWNTNNPVLALGEPGINLDTGQIKIGDGVTNWNSLPYSMVGPTGPAIAEFHPFLLMGA